MPRLKSQRPALTVLGEPAPGDEASPPPREVAPQPEPAAPMPSGYQGPQAEQILRGLPASLTNEMKMVSVRWRGGCFCCPAIISFGQCISGMWAASRKPKQEADSLAHWGLNAAKFLYEAGPPQGPGAAAGGGGAAALGRMLLVEGGYMPLAAAVLGAAGAGEELPQGMMLTPQVSFTQVWAVGTKQLPLTTTPQLVLVQLLGQITDWTPGLRAAAHCPELLTALVRTLAATSDDRYRSLVLSTLTDWLGVVDEEEDDEDEEEDGEDKPAAAAASPAGENGSSSGTSGGGSKKAGAAKAGKAGAPASPHLFGPAEHDALVHALLDAGLAPALAAVAGKTANAVALRNVAACALALMTAGAGTGGHGGGAGGHGGAASRPAGGAAGGGGKGRAASAAALTDPELPEGLVLRGAAQCRAQAELVKAGMVQALLVALSRPPCPPASGASSAAAAAAAAASGPLVFWLAINMGVTGARLLELQWWLLVVARVLLVPPETGPAAAAADAGAADAAPSASSGGGKGGKSGGGKRKGGSGGAGANGSAGGDAVKRRAAAADTVLAAPVLQQQLKGLEAQEGAGAAAVPAAETPTERALQLLSAAVTASSRGCVLPWGTPLELLPARERAAIPDWRAAQRDRIRKAAEEARAAAAQASAAAAVDLLSKLAV